MYWGYKSRKPSTRLNRSVNRSRFCHPPRNDISEHCRIRIRVGDLRRGLYRSLQLLRFCDNWRDLLRGLLSLNRRRLWILLCCALWRLWRLRLLSRRWRRSLSEHRKDVPQPGYQPIHDGRYLPRSDKLHAELNKVWLLFCEFGDKSADDLVGVIPYRRRRHYSALE